MAQAVIPKKSSTSTEVLRVRTAPIIAGALADPTGYVVKVAALAASHPGGKRAPLDADYVTMSWETGTGPRYWVAALMGPTATLIPAGPSSSETEILYELWVWVAAGSENVKRMAGYFAVTP